MLHCLVCNDKDAEVKTQVIARCTSPKLRRKGLSETTWTVARLLKVGKAYEVSQVLAKEIEQAKEKVS